LKKIILLAIVLCRFSLTIVAIAILLGNQSCNETNEARERCSSKQVRDHSGFYRYLMTNNGPSLVKYDSLNFKSIRQYILCEDIGVENSKIVDIEGAFSWSCTLKDTLIRVKNFKIIENCVVAPSLFGSYSLAERSWLVESVVVNGKTYLPPCEGQSIIYFESDNSFGGVLSINSFGGQYSIISNVIKIEGSVAIGLLVGTTSQILFERTMVLAFQSGTELEYQIVNNRLRLINSSQSMEINLYTI
jgi:hypothetical protein